MPGPARRHDGADFFFNSLHWRTFYHATGRNDKESSRHKDWDRSYRSIGKVRYNIFMGEERLTHGD